ncbi:MAG: type II toxin-antitoxin system VapC family toxin [Devosia sp.]
MRLIVDASVATKWAVDEDGHAAAVSLVTADHELLVPDFVFVEIGNALWKKVVRQEISKEQAVLAATEVRIAFSDLLPTVELAEPALMIALELGHPIYDCIYLAAAEEFQARVVTADRRLLSKIAGTRFSDLAVSLDDVGTK